MFDDDELLPQATDQIADEQFHPDVVSLDRDIDNDSSQQHDNGCSDVEDDASIVSDIESISASTDPSDEERDVPVPPVSRSEVMPIGPAEVHASPEQVAQPNTRLRRPVQNWWVPKTKQAFTSKMLDITLDDIDGRICKIKFGCPEVYHISVKKGIEQYGAVAKKSIQKELTQMVNKSVWHYVHDAPYNKFIRSSMFLKEKISAPGGHMDLKSRLVARGDQMEMKLYDNWSSPTIRSDSVEMIIKIAAVERRHVNVIDIGGAYLNAHMDDDVYMLLAPDIAAELFEIDSRAAKFQRHDGSVMVKLDRALYGCKQSGKLWHNRLKEFLLSLGFTQNKKDTCVFNYTRDGVQITIGLHVDDLLTTSKNKDHLKWLYDKLRDEFKELKLQDGPELLYLGRRVRWDKDGNIVVSMEDLTREILEGVAGQAPSPANSSVFHFLEISDANPLLGRADREKFHSLVCKVHYLALHARPDLLTAVSPLTARVQAPTEHDRVRLDRILKYLRGKPVYPKVITTAPFTRVKSWCDASWGVHPKAKSHTGLAIFIGGTLVHYRSSKQKMVSVNSTEAELIALSDKLIDMVSCHEFLIEKGMQLKTPIVYQDNTSAMILSSDDAKMIRNKHILARQQMIQQWVRDSDLKIKYVSTTDMIADFFTKPLQGKRFTAMCDVLLGYSRQVGGGAMESASDDETSTAKKSPTLPKKLPHQGPHAHMAVSKSKVDCAKGSNNEDNRTRDGDSRGQKRLYRKLSSSSTGKCCCWSVRDVPG